MLDSVAQRLDALLNRLDSVERAILNEVLERHQPPKLDNISATRGLRREQVQQKQTELERKIKSCVDRDAKDSATQLAKELDLIDSYTKVELHVQRAVPQASETVQRVLSRSMVRLAGYTYANGSIISERARSLVNQVKILARTAADNSGLINREKLIESLPEKAVRQHFIWFQQQCGLHEMFGMLALRRTRKAKLKAALLNLGRPATRPELAAMCNLTNKIASAALSSIPEIVRISRTQWALREWGLHEYRGIVEEIVDYIDREGGIAEVESLIEEIAQRFDVKKWSVRAYMQTAKFHMRDGMIRIADQSSPTIRPLVDVIHGRDDQGRPYWTFPVLERYFRGYSVVGVPFEIAEYLGCPPDNATRLKVSNLVDCHDLTIQWYLSSTTKASIGFVRDALERLNLKDGQFARLTLVQKGEIALNWHPSSTTDSR